MKWEGGTGNLEVGSRTRRRPMGRDYAAAKDAGVGRGKSELFDVGFYIADLLYRYALSHFIKLTEYLKSKIQNLNSQIITRDVIGIITG